MSRTRPLARGSLLLAALIAASVPAATVYRWVDEKGVTHYSDAPPAGRHSSELALPSPPPRAAADTDWRSIDEAFRERHEARMKQRDEEIRNRRLEAELDAIKAGKRTPVPGETFAEPDFQKRVLWALVSADQAAAPGCTDHSIVDTESVGRDVDKQELYERWVLDRCGERVQYRVTFTPFHVARAWPQDAGGRKTMRGSHVILDDSAAFTFQLEPPPA